MPGRFFVLCVETLESEEERGEGDPLFVERTGEGPAISEAAGAAVPVGGIEGITLFAVEISVDARGFGSIHVLCDGVSVFPFAVGVVPKSMEERRKCRGFRGWKRAEFISRHEVIMRQSAKAADPPRRFSDKIIIAIEEGAKAINFLKMLLI